MGRSAVRLKDIAEKTGFSTNTVSLALRNSPRIPPVTRERIQKAARELNYLPNQIAKSLVNRETRTIGLVLTQISNPALTATAEALELQLAARGYGMLFATSNNTIDDEIKALDMFRARQVDGILIYPTSPDRLEHIRALRLANYPVVLLVNDRDASIDSVAIDDRQGAERATRHLIGLGHRRIGMIGNIDPRRNRHKFEGYRKALTEAGIAFDPGLCADPAGPGPQHGYLAAAGLMARTAPPGAIFAVTDTLALGALKWARDNGLGVPGDLAIIGFDNIELAEFAATPLSSIDYAAGAVSDGAVARLMQLIAAGGDLPGPETILIPPDLIVRQSTAG